LSPDAAIVNNKSFENAIVKHLGSEALSVEDVAALRRLEAGAQGNAVNRPAGVVVPNNYAAQIIQQHRDRVQEEQPYVDMTRIPITSNVVERFFSHVKLNMTYTRNCLHPETLEVLMFLKLNASYMTVNAVQQGMNMGAMVANDGPAVGAAAEGEGAVEVQGEEDGSDDDDETVDPSINAAGV
jgi:hypothetical protein